MFHVVDVVDYYACIVVETKSRSMILSAKVHKCYWIAFEKNRLTTIEDGIDAFTVQRLSITN